MLQYSYFEVKMFQIIVWVGVVLSLIHRVHLHFLRFFRGKCDKRIQIFSVRWVLHCAHKLNMYSSSIIGLPSRLYVFGILLHDLVWIPMVPRAIQWTSMLIIIISFIFSFLFQCFTGLVWPFFHRWWGWLVAYTRLIGFYIMVFTITLVMEYILGSFKFLS